MADDITDGGMDIEKASDSIAADLNLGQGDDEPVEESVDEQADAGQAPAPDAEAAPDEEAATQPAPAAPAPPPKSWAKEKHELWSKLPPEAHEQINLREKQILEGLTSYAEDAKFGRPLKEAIAPYMPILQSRGIEPAKAVAALLNAQKMLDHDPMAGIAHIAKSYGINLADLANGAPAQAQLDPAVKQLQDKLAQVESVLTMRQQSEYRAAQEQAAAEVNKFADDPAHPYFDDVAEDVVLLIKSGATLKDAYEKAVWANPVTRAKELARIQKDADDKKREKQATEAKQAAAAKKGNIRSRDTNRTPTEPLGTMEDTMRATLKDIRSRPH